MKKSKYLLIIIILMMFSIINVNAEKFDCYTVKYKLEPTTKIGFGPYDYFECNKEIDYNQSEDKCCMNKQHDPDDDSYFCTAYNANKTKIEGNHWYSDTEISGDGTHCVKVDSNNNQNNGENNNYNNGENNNQINVNKVETSCKGIFGGFEKDIKKFLDAIGIIAPILVGAFSVYEYLIAIINKDADELRKCNGRLVKRLILMAILFFLPTMVDLLLKLLGNNYGVCIEK